MKAYLALAAILCAASIVAGCNNGGGNSSSNNSGVQLKALIAVPNVGATTNFSFDISAVDAPGAVTTSPIATTSPSATSWRR